MKRRFETDDCLLHILLIIIPDIQDLACRLEMIMSQLKWIDLFCCKFPSGGVVGKIFWHMGVLRSS